MTAIGRDQPRHTLGMTAIGRVQPLIFFTPSKNSKSTEAFARVDHDAQNQPLKKSMLLGMITIITSIGRG
jgi:hypothetical protein